MGRFKPCASGYENKFGGERCVISISKPTYAELLSVVKKSLKSGECDNFHVYRSRRGEWGEWFEIWEIKNKTPKIIKEGWQ